MSKKPGITWYGDETARIAYERARYLLDRPLAELFPGLVLNHMGVHRNELYDGPDDERAGEVVIKLHLRPIGTARVSGARTPPPGHFTSDPARSGHGAQDITPEDLLRIEQAYLRLK